MAFKMNNPMKKNFGSALNITEAQEKNLNPGLVAAIKKSEGDSPKEMKKDNAPMMRLDSAAMKAMGAPMKTDRGIGAVKEKNEPKFGDKDYKKTELDEFYDEENDPEGLFVGSGGSDKKNK
tara:strand:- start:205 stop:567 length:363 start_codon:yes stop_codon:yes gene_type:complete